MSALAMQYARVGGLVALMLVGGCIRSRVTGFDPGATYERRTPAEQIRMYGEQRPTCPYKEVGRVTAEGGLFTRWERVVRKARQRAYEMGGDAIVGINERTRISGATVSKNGVSTTESTSIAGNVIRFTTQDCRE